MAKSPSKRRKRGIGGMPKEERRIPIVISEREGANKHKKAEPDKAIRTRKTKCFIKKTKNKPYSIYECNGEWLFSAKKSRRHAHAAFVREGSGKFGLLASDGNESGMFVEENKSTDPQYSERIVPPNDHEYFICIYSLLKFIEQIREFNYHVPPRVGRSLESTNRLESIENTISQDDQFSNQNRFQIYSDVQKTVMKQAIRTLLRSNINKLLNAGEYFQYFNLHPAVLLFINTINCNGIDVTYGDDFNEYYSVDMITAFVNCFNKIFNEKSYKRMVSKRLFDVEANIKSVISYAMVQKESDTQYVMRFCLGFNCPLDDEYDGGFENKLKGERKTSKEMRDFRLKSLHDGRNAILRNSAKKPIMDHVNGFLWKFDYCSVRGYYIHLFLFLTAGWKKSFDVMESIGNTWRQNVGNGDIFKYCGGKQSFELKKEGEFEKLTRDVEILFRQDALAYVNTTLSDGKKLRIFGKGVMHSMR